MNRDQMMLALGVGNPRPRPGLPERPGPPFQPQEAAFEPELEPEPEAEPEVEVEVEGEPEAEPSPIESSPVAQLASAVAEIRASLDALEAKIAELLGGAEIEPPSPSPELGA